ncbi:sushi domain-containing protein 3 [Xenentodon cancila]
MSAATASVADIHRRTNFTQKDDNLVLSNSGDHQLSALGYLQAQCKPIPLPALGTQRIVQGNGTNVGTVISLQCPAKHKLVGKELTCVMDINSTHWVGETYCIPLTPHEDYGFRVAVLASVVSSVIILLMSMAFLTCCLVDCIKKDKKKRQER